MARLLVGLRRELRSRYPPHPLCPTGPTINIGVKALGGVGYGVLPGHAEFWTDIRTTPGMTQAELREDVDAALAEPAPDPGRRHRTSVEFHPRPWLARTDRGRARSPGGPRRPAAAAAEVLGASAAAAAFPGATDAWASRASAACRPWPPSARASCPSPTARTSGSAYRA